MIGRRVIAAVLSVATAVAGVGGVAAALTSHSRVRAEFSEAVLDSMEHLLEPSTPLPRTGDTSLGAGRYRSDDPCADVQSAWDGVVVSTSFGWVLSVSLPTGDAAVIGAPDPQGCSYELTNTEPIELIGVDAPGLGRFRAFANVACTTAPIAGAFAEFIGPDGNPMVVILAAEFGAADFGGESTPTSTDPPLGEEQAGTLQLFSGRYHPDGKGMTQVAGLEGTLFDLGDGFMFTSGEVAVGARCTPVDPAALVPTGIG